MQCNGEWIVAEFKEPGTTCVEKNYANIGNSKSDSSVFFKFLYSLLSCQRMIAWWIPELSDLKLFAKSETISNTFWFLTHLKYSLKSEINESHGKPLGWTWSRSPWSRVHSSLLVALDCQVVFREMSLRLSSESSKSPTLRGGFPKLERYQMIVGKDDSKQLGKASWLILQTRTYTTFPNMLHHCWIFWSSL